MNNNQLDSIDYVHQEAEAGKSLLGYVQRFNWFLLASLTAIAWYVFSWKIAQSVLVGGLLANVSFFMLRLDLAFG